MGASNHLVTKQCNLGIIEIRLGNIAWFEHDIRVFNHIFNDLWDIRQLQLASAVLAVKVLMDHTAEQWKTHPSRSQQARN